MAHFLKSSSLACFKISVWWYEVRRTFPKGGSPGLVVMGGDSSSEGRGFESQCRILDGHDIFSH